MKEEQESKENQSRRVHAGRPKGSGIYSHSISMRVSGELYGKLQQQAREKNYSTVSAYVRNYMLKKSSNIISSSMSLANISFVSGYTAEVKKIGNNVNQITRKIHTLGISEEKIIGYEVKKMQELLKSCVDITQKIDNILNEEAKKTLGRKR